MKDSELKIDGSQEGRSWANTVNLKDYCNEYQEAQNAFDAKRNIADFLENDISWVNCDIVIPGAFYNSIIAVWQNEDGSVSLLMNSKNGTDLNFYCKKITLLLKDDKLGDILDSSAVVRDVSPSPSVASKTAKNIIVTYTPESVKTGTKTWERLSYDLNVKF